MLKFRTDYQKVFTPEGQIKPCGREACKELIEDANRIGIGDFGNEETGVMNVDAIRGMYDELLYRHAFEEARSSYEGNYGGMKFNWAKRQFEG